LSTPEPESTEHVRDLPGLGAFATLGLTIACTLGAFVGLGIWADAELGTSPWCLLAGIVLGCAAAIASTVVLVRRYL
jgi:F0F1-type ATP synthase assembly protein I